MAHRESPLKKDFIQITAHIADAAGHDYLLGVIFGTLFLQPREIAMEDLAKACGYSLASVSQKLKVIEQLNVLKKSTRPGSRKIYLSLEKDLVHVWLKQIYGLGEKKINLAKEKLPLLLAKYKDKLKTPADRRLYATIQNYYRQIIIFDKIMNEFKQIINKYTKQE